MSAADTFEGERDRLWGIAYRMLGSRHDADDIVQEAWIRWSAQSSAHDGKPIERPAAWLTTVTSRLAIDRLRSRKTERATYVGPWLPEPLEMSPDPAELAESVTIGFLTLLERLEPVERIVLLLADVFDEPFDDIAGIVGKTPAACRQIAVRARQRVRDERRQRPATASPGQDALARFGMACATGDIATLIRLLGDDVVLVSDGGPQRHAARRPVVGPDRVARFCVNIAKRIPAHAILRPAMINAQPGLVVEIDDHPDTALVLDLDGDRIAGIYVVVNPDKLHGLRAPYGYPSQP